VVIGAGLAGLAAARTLQQAGRPVVVVEASDGVGGRVRTDVVDGFRLDRGFQVLLTAYPEVPRQLDTATLRLCSFDAGAIVRVGGRFWRVGDPQRHPRLVPGSIVAPIGGLADKLRLARFLLRLRRAEPRALLGAEDVSTLEALRAEGFGERIIDRFFRPLLGGIQLDSRLTGSRRMSDVVLRCLALGDSAVPADGMQAIPDQMAAALEPGTVVLGRAVTSVAPGTVTVEGGATVLADHVVLATDGPAASGLLRRPAVRSRPVSCVWFSAPAAPLHDKLIVLDGSGSGPALNVAVMTNVAESYSSTGGVLIAAACPGAWGVGLEQPVRAQLRGWWGVHVDGWRHLRTDTIAHGQPDHRPPFSPKQSVSLGDGLFVCGDHRDTPSIQGALFSGRRCGEIVASAAATARRT
jgi:glycine/D-amino acid oxidase-like deaminating enzyme